MNGKHAVEIAHNYSAYCDDQAEKNYPQNLVAWQMWKDHAAGARKVAVMLEYHVAGNEWLATQYSMVGA